MAITERKRRARRLLYQVVCAYLAIYGAVVIVRGTLATYDEEGMALMFKTVGLVGIWLWTRWGSAPDPA